MMFTLVLFFITFTYHCTGDELNERRLDVIFVGNDWGNQHAFSIGCFNGVLQWTADANSKTDRTSWTKLSAPGDGYCFSNPVTNKGQVNTTYLLVQDTSGQVYICQLVVTQTSLEIGQWIQVGGNLPFEKDAHIHGFDSVVVKEFENKIYTFARSYSNSSKLYWSAVNLDETSTKWTILGGSSVKLMTDVSVVYNSFTKLMEAFVVATDGYMYRTWQVNFEKWSDWDKTGFSAPKTSHAPIAHDMDTNMFNGRLNVFVHGNDGKLHHIWQTTCDKVPNPWGWCTWSTWNQISGDIPINQNYPTNSLSIGNNLHLGIEVFVVDQKGQLYKTWQLQRHGKYSDWELVQFTEQYNMASLPKITNDPSGWWLAYAMDSNNDLIIIQQDRKFSVSPTSVESGWSLTVNWFMPVDEASSKDWIGVYQSGASNKAYVDYVYVGGSQNPMSEVITNGNVSFITYLPHGSYDIRYLVNRQFVAAAGTSLTISKSTGDPEWVQIFKGIFTGLNITAVDVESCVKDAEDIPVKFHASFQKFKDRAIYEGLRLLGVAIGDIVKGMVDCGVKDAITGRIKVFVDDLISCVSSKNVLSTGLNPTGIKSCTHFFVDVAKELLVLYENVYEIYGDIRGASNCFDIKAYAQGGVNVGRVIGACIALPR